MNILEYLQTYCDEVTPREFYRDMFPPGELEKAGEYERGKYCGIAVSVKGRKVKRYSVTDDLDAIDELCSCDEFSLMSPISYAGKERSSANARFLYALAIDLDGIRTKEYNGTPEGMETLFYQFDGNGPSNYLPLPTYIVFSGSGVHLYYFFEKPIPLFRNVVKALEQYKRRLTWQLWTQGVTDREHQEHIQYESLFQGFRIPGTVTKDGNRARAFMVGKGGKVTLEYLNQFVPEANRIESIVYKSKLTLQAAKEKYPEWYQKRVIEGDREKGHWTCKRDLYDWWKGQIRQGATFHHRYFNIMCLAIYAVKSGIDEEELKEDAMKLQPFLNDIAPTEPFTESDIESALECFDERYVRFPIDDISRLSGITIQKNKRNGRTQEKHLAGARAIRDINNDNWREGNGRKSKEPIVKEWRSKHPDGKKAECIRDTGLSKPTVYKHWD